MKKLNLLAQIDHNFVHRPKDAFLRSYKQICRKNAICIQLFEGNAGQRIYQFNAFYFVSPKDDTDNLIVISQKYVHRIPFHPKVAPIVFGRFVARIQTFDELPQKHVAHQILTHFEVDGYLIEIFGIANTIKARNRRNHDDVGSSGKQCRRGRKAQFLDFGVDGQIFFDIRVGGRDIGFGLIIIVVRNIIFHRIVRKKALELAVELGCKRFVVTDDQRRLVDLRNDVGYRKSFARTRNTQQRLVRNFIPQAFYQRFYGLRLIAGWFVF
ncbi:MAG: hypothetical protein BWZ06_01350 [Bacteroidetes bacterium ADurb.BinA261]|nr:MAG: hypothetical protein BWZ06_01350 [Bacteroidetes bacterium ADurb.BinA261]